MSEKSKLIYYKNSAPKIFVSNPKFQLFITKNDGKAATYLETSVTNQMGQLKKRFKEAWENLEITDGSLSNKNAIWPKSKVLDKWKQVKITCPWYFCIKALMKDRFDNI